MRIKISILAWILMSFGIVQAQDTVKLNSKVKKVVVFMKGAQIQRKATCKLLKGQNLLNFTGISSQADEKTIHVKSDSSLAIQSVVFELNYMDSLVRIQKFNILQKRIDSLDNEKLVLENSLFVLKNEQELLNENQVLGGVKRTMNTEELEKACEYYRARLSEIASLKNKSQNRIKEIDIEKSRINNQLIELNLKKEKPIGEIMVLVYAKESGNQEFTIDYFIGDAGWVPKYDIRAESVNNPATLGYKADVYQNTDDDWTNVELILSSSNPSLGGTKPELKSWTLNVNENYSQSNNYSDNSNYQNSVAYYNDIKNNYSNPIQVENEMTISGTVICADDGMGLPGVTILVKGTPNGTISDIEGHYSVKVPKGSQRLIFQFIGMNTEELPITGTVVNCCLAASELMLQDVVVTALGVSREKKAMGYSSTTLVNDGFGNFVPEYSLAGKTAGVIVSRDKTDRMRTTKKKLINKTLEGLNKTKENQTSVQFLLDKPYTIPSDNKKYAVDIEKYEIPVHFQYSTVPKMEPSAFLLAQLTDWGNLNLLTGEVNIYFEGSYIGSSKIDTENISDTLDISMGRDKAIMIDRKLKEDFNKKQSIKNSKIENYTWEITVKNNKTEKINIELEDQIPLSYSKNFEVELLESTGAKYDKNKGELKWALELAPLEKKVLTFSYQIKIKNT